MTRRVALDWRRVVVYVHRWLGIAGCLLFIAWFASGVVMMYARMPSLSAQERLQRLPALDLSAATIAPHEAAAVAGFTPDSVRLGMLGDRPVYRFTAGGAWFTVRADTGDLLDELPPDEALVLARQFMPEHAASMRYDRYLLDSDQWTLSSALRPLMPLHRLTMGDAAGTALYISALTGDPVMKTTRRERVWGYLGAVLHWLYFTPFRRDTALWVDTIIWLSIAGSVMCLSGIVWGLWRYSPSGRYRLRREPSHSPYAGMMKWHHYAGLVFGLTTFTWIFSGLMSMTPWNWSPGTAPTRAQREAVAGGPLGLDGVTLEGLREGLAQIAPLFPARELELTQFGGEPFLLAYRPPEAADDAEWGNTDLPAFLADGTLDHRLVSLVTPSEGPRTGFEPARIEAAATAAMPAVPIVDATWLDAYDAYYYDRTGALPLPVLRTRYADAQQTWLYLDPGRGVVVRKTERLSRLERWLYHGLHSLDFPFLYDRRPLWDLVLIVLSLGGLVSTVTVLQPSWHRLRQHARKWRAGVTRTRAGIAGNARDAERARVRDTSGA